MSANDAVDAALAGQEALARDGLTQPADPIRSTVDLAKDAVAAERRKLSEIQKRFEPLDDEIGAVLARTRRRQRSVWGRLFPDRAAEERLKDLKARRMRLTEERDLATGPLLKALGAEHRAEQAFKDARMLDAAERAKRLNAARQVLARITRARVLLRHWPSLAYSGTRTLLARAAKIETARRKGTILVVDPKPSLR